MRFALGRVGLSEGEYVRMTLRQFLLRADSFHERLDDEWDLTRLVIVVMNNLRNRKKIRETDVVKLKRDVKRMKDKQKDYDRIREKARRIKNGRQ